MKKYFTPRMLTCGAALVAINVILTKFLSITLTFVRIGFNFLPNSLGSMIFGPVTGGLLAVIADILGVVIVGEPFFWGYSVSALLYGLTYGLFLYKREKSYKNIAFCILLQTVFIDALLGAFWANLFFGKPYFIALLGRCADAVPMAFVKVYMIKHLWKYTEKALTNLIKG